jgi:hypothetical protein
MERFISLLAMVAFVAALIAAFLTGRPRSSLKTLTHSRSPDPLKGLRIPRVHS